MVYRQIAPSVEQSLASSSAEILEAFNTLDRSPTTQILTLDGGLPLKPCLRFVSNFLETEGPEVLALR